MRLLRLASVVVLLIAGGCSTTESNQTIEANQNAVRSWYGADQEALIESWGPPTAEEERAGGGRVLEWAEHYRGLPKQERAGERAALQSLGPGYGGALGGFLGEVLGGAIYDYSGPPSDCITRVIVSPEGVVEVGLMTGNGCSPPPAR